MNNLQVKAIIKLVNPAKKMAKKNKLLVEALSQADSITLKENTDLWAFLKVGNDESFTIAISNIGISIRNNDKDLCGNLREMYLRHDFKNKDLLVSEILKVFS